jgi:hypothetical protein
MFLSQVNYVSNGSFENILNCNSPFIDYKAIGWSGVDSTKFTAFLYHKNCGNVPISSVGFQNPKHEKAFIRLGLYYPQGPSNFTRSNIKNRLRNPLQAGKIYCSTIFVNLVDKSPLAINGFGMYFGGSDLDTIKYYARLPLTFIMPQVSNPTGNIINDTAYWLPVTGTFVANGGEKYLVVGNFKSDAATNTALSVGNYTAPIAFSEYFVDQVSCVELDPEFAGRDTTILPGDSLFIGKTNDDSWLEAKFTWHKLPDSATIDTTGFWVKPVSTCSYVVKQEICSYTIWDTIVIRIKEDDTRITTYRADFLKVFPMPAEDRLKLKTEVPQWYEGLSQFLIVNGLGQEIVTGKVDLSNGSFIIDVSKLPGGVYTLTVFGDGRQKVVKRILISG